MTRLLRWLIEWLIALMAWFLFTFSVSWAEAAVGAVCAALAVVSLEVVFRAEPLLFHPTPCMLAQIRAVPSLIVQGLWTLACVLWDRLKGNRSQSVFRIVPFSANGSEERQAAQRILVTSFLTTPPNSIVLGIDEEAKHMLIHQVKAAPVSKLVRNLEGDR